MDSLEITRQAELDAIALREECELDGREFVLLPSDDWDAIAFGYLDVPDEDQEQAWPIYCDALRSAIRAMGGRA